MDHAEMTELAEHIANSYSRSHGIRRYSTWHLLRLQDEAAEAAQSWVEMSGQRLPVGERGGASQALATDLCDVLVQTLVLARELGVDLPAELKAQAAAASEDAELSERFFPEPD